MYYSIRLADLGSVSTHSKVAGTHQMIMTSSKPLGGTHSMSILQLAKATNALTLSTMVTGGSGPITPPEPEIPISASVSNLDDLDEKEVPK
jgi:hypothetical protein